MNILFYISNIDKSTGGVFQYSYALLSILSKSEHQFYMYKVDNPEIQELISANKNLHLLEYNDYTVPAKIRILKKIISKINSVSHILKIKKYLKSKYKIPIIDYVVEKYKIDIIHCPFQYLPETTLNIPTITTMHDVQELHFPEFFTSSQREYRAINYKKAIDKADAIIVSYLHIKNDLVKYFAKDEHKIHVCLLDMQNLWFDKFKKSDILDLKDYNIPENFIFYPAATWEHKNHLNIVEAIKILNDERKIKVNLVCSSHKTEFYTVIENKIKEYNLENQINFIGTVSDKILYSLYHKAEAVVIPTLYEAGSFPLMESIILGIPVICSNVTSLPETIGEDQFIFDPKNPNDIAEKIYSILYDKELKKQNVLNSAKQKSKILNNNTITIIDNIYKTLANANT